MSKYPPRSMAKQQLLDNQAFLTQLATLLAQASGSVYLTQKKVDAQNTQSTLASVVPDAIAAPESSQLLLRATDGKSIKISTRVSARDVLTFMEKYAEVCRAGMSTGLKKRDRKKTKKVK